MDSRLIAYSYLKEDSKKCDYEIITDLLASDMGLAMHYVKHICELERLVALVYHANGSIRGRCAITENDTLWLLSVYDKYQSLVDNHSNFYLPIGCKGASHLHHLRSMTKMCVRLAYKIEKEQIKVNSLLIDFLNLLSNTLFLMALYENKCENVTEVVFESKSYDL